MKQNCFYPELLQRLYISKKTRALVLIFIGIAINIKANDYTIIENNIRTKLINENVTNIIPSNSLHAYLSINGKYSNINYNDNNLVTWAPYHHVDRIFRLAVTYAHPSSIKKGDEIILNNIIAGLTFWANNKPISKNWWYNKIAIPEKISQTLILLSEEELVSTDLRNDLIKSIYYELDPYTGANRTRIAINQFSIGIITKNKALVTSSRNEILSSLKIGETDGIQHDYSFHSHGEQLYLHGYGSTYIRNILDFCMYIKNTQFKLDEAELLILNSYTLYGYLPIIRNDHVDYNATGRVLSRNNSLKVNDLDHVIDMLIAVNSEPNIIEKINQYKFENVSINKFYWKSDYIIHSTPSVFYSVRAVSNRTRQAEKGNGENLKGGNLSHGSVSIRKRGSEYFNIFPIWDWNRIPGTTTVEGMQSISTEWGEKGNSDFVGGLALPGYSTMVYAMNANGINAIKGYFFFNDIMLCMGSDINSDKRKDVFTTINQVYLSNDLSISTLNSKIRLPRYFNITRSDIKHIIHDGILYYFPYKSNINVRTDKRKGNWNSINVSGNKDEVQADIMSVIIPHGPNSKNGSYAYLVAPYGESIKNELEYIRVIANNNSIQAALDTKNNILQAIFIKPTTLKVNNTIIKSDNPIIMIIENFDQENYKIHLSDPTQKLGNLRLTINKKRYEVALPTNEYSGSTFKIER